MRESIESAAGGVALSGFLGVAAEPRHPAHAIPRSENTDNAPLRRGLILERIIVRELVPLQPREMGRWRKSPSSAMSCGADDKVKVKVQNAIGGIKEALRSK